MILQEPLPLQLAPVLARVGTLWREGGLCSAFPEPLNYRLMSRAPMADLVSLITSALETAAKRNLTGVRHQLEATQLPRQKSGVSYARHIITVPS